MILLGYFDLDEQVKIESCEAWQTAMGVSFSRPLWTFDSSLYGRGLQLADIPKTPGAAISELVRQTDHKLYRAKVAFEYADARERTLRAYIARNPEEQR